MSQPKNALYAQSGGVTAVINATASAVISACRQDEQVGTLYAARNGILGALREDLIDTAQFSSAELDKLAQTPGGIFGSCRFKLKAIEEHEQEYRRLIEVFKAHNIGYFFYNGGNDSADTSLKVSQIGTELDYPVTCVGIPKTIDNDLAVTDCCPGFGSAAKYVATSMQEAGLDVVAMAETSTKVFVMEVMGRHAGWLAAAAGLAAQSEDQAPHIILFPEIPFDEKSVLARVEECVQEYGFCAIAVSEGVQDHAGNFLADAGSKDAFGHAQLGGAGAAVASLITEKLGYKHHRALLDYLQRSARHLASQTDLEHALAVGQSAVAFATAGKNATMPVIHRQADAPYEWEIREAQLADIANKEKTVPRNFIDQSGMGLTQLALDYLEPLIQGEAFPAFRNGLPDYLRKSLELAPKKLSHWDIEG